MGNHHDADITEMVVVINRAFHGKLNEAVEMLKGSGMEIISTNEDHNVVEGSCESCKVGDLQKLSCVDYVRSVMTYVADYPVGDPRDKDGAEEDE